MSKKMSAFSIAMAFAGTITGAGFSSGQEQMQFFGDFGLMGILGAALTVVLFTFYAYIVMKLARHKDSDNFSEMMVPLEDGTPKKALMGLADVATLTFYFCLLVVMGAGCGALLNEAIGLPVILGSGLVLFATGIVVYLGLESVQRGFNITVSILVVGVVLVAVIAILNPMVSTGNSGIIENIMSQAKPNESGFKWLQKATEFVLYNTFACLGVIVVLGRIAKDDKTLLKGAGLGSFITSGLAVIIVLAIVMNFSLVEEAVMPMITLAQNISTPMGWFYIVLMVLAIFSTLLGIMFGIVKKVEGYKFYQVKYNPVLIIAMCVVAMFGAKIGFVTLIGVIYPFYGYISAIALVGFCINYYKTFMKKERRVEN